MSLYQVSVSVKNEKTRTREVGALIQAMDELLSNRDLAASIGSNAYRDYQNKHTWTIRAESIISIAKKL